MNVSVYHDDHCVILRVLAVYERNSFSYGSSKSPVIGHMFVISGVCFEVKQDFESWHLARSYTHPRSRLQCSHL